jgi:hypothetical protein
MATDPAAARELCIETETAPSETIFRLIGKITSESASELPDAGPGAIPAKKAGCEIQLVSLTPRLKEFLRVPSLDQLFAVSRFPDKPSF